MAQDRTATCYFHRMPILDFIEEEVASGAYAKLNMSALNFGNFYGDPKGKEQLCPFAMSISHIVQILKYFKRTEHDACDS